MNLNCNPCKIKFSSSSSLSIYIYIDRERERDMYIRFCQVSTTELKERVAFELVTYIFLAKDITPSIVWRREAWAEETFDHLP